jgi:hypothetical protein
MIYVWRTHRQFQSQHVPTNEGTRLIFNIYHHGLVALVAWLDQTL